MRLPAADGVWIEKKIRVLLPVLPVLCPTPILRLIPNLKQVCQMGIFFALMSKTMLDHPDATDRQAAMYKVGTK